jgi:hypothetical protein
VGYVNLNDEYRAPLFFGKLLQLDQLVECTRVAGYVTASALKQALQHD